MAVIRPQYDGFQGWIESECISLMYELEKVEYAEAKKHYSSCIDLIGEYTDHLLLSEKPVKYCVKTFEALKTVCFTRIREIKKFPPVDNYEKIEGLLRSYFEHLDRESRYYSRFDGGVNILKSLLGAGFSDKPMSESLANIEELDSAKLEEAADQLDGVAQLFTEDGMKSHPEKYQFNTKRCNKDAVKLFESLVGRRFEELHS